MPETVCFYILRTGCLSRFSQVCGELQLFILHSQPESLKMSDNDEHQPSKVRKICQGEEEPATANQEATSPAVKDVTATTVDATAVLAAVAEGAAKHEGNNTKTENDEEEELFSFFEKKDDESTGQEVSTRRFQIHILKLSHTLRRHTMTYTPVLIFSKYFLSLAPEFKSALIQSQIGHKTRNPG